MTVACCAAQEVRARSVPRALRRTGHLNGRAVRTVAVSRMGPPGSAAFENTDPPDVRTIEHRMLSFVNWCGEIPKDATRMSDIELMQHPMTWGRWHRAKSAPSDMIGFTHREHWWVLCFEQIDTFPGGAEVWGIEACSSGAQSWARGFIYEPGEDRWRSVLPHGSRS
jgi:hypothetical protein